MAAPELPSAAFAHGPKSGEAGRGSGVPNWGVSGEVSGEVGGLTGAENLQPNLFPEKPFTESPQNPPDDLQSSASDIKEARRVVWEATGYVPPIAGGAPNPSEEPGQTDDRPEPYYSSRYLEMEIDWTKDLSSDGQWLFRELLIGAENIELLKQFAQNDGADLDAAIAELDQHGLIDKSDRGYFHLPYKKIPSSGEEE